MGDYRHVSPKLAVRSDPPSTYFGYDTRIRNNMMAMDRRAASREEDSFNIMKMLTYLKRYSTPREYIKQRNSMVKRG